jgi:hypothetical protein
VLPLTWLAAQDVFECADPMGSIQEERVVQTWLDQEWGSSGRPVRLSALRSERQPLRNPSGLQGRTETGDYRPSVRCTAVRRPTSPAGRGQVVAALTKQTTLFGSTGKGQWGPAEPILNHKGAVSQSRRWCRFLNGGLTQLRRRSHAASSSAPTLVSDLLRPRAFGDHWLEQLCLLNVVCSSVVAPGQHFDD